MPDKFDKVMLYAVNLVIFSIVVLKKTKQPLQLITKKYQLFLLNNTYNIMFARFDSECFWEVRKTPIFGVKSVLVLLPELYCTLLVLIRSV